MSTTFYQQIISFLCLFIASGAVTAQNSDVLFFNEVDTTFQKVRLGYLAFGNSYCLQLHYRSCNGAVRKDIQVRAGLQPSS